MQKEKGIPSDIHHLKLRRIVMFETSFVRKQNEQNPTHNRSNACTFLGLQNNQMICQQKMKNRNPAKLLIVGSITSPDLGDCRCLTSFRSANDSAALSGPVFGKSH